jgi:hypothetical protein
VILLSLSLVHWDIIKIDLKKLALVNWKDEKNSVAIV